MRISSLAPLIRDHALEASVTLPTAASEVFIKVRRVCVFMFMRLLFLRMPYGKEQTPQSNYFPGSHSELQWVVTNELKGQVSIPRHTKIW
jgi:hypothetical protein